MFPLTKFVWWVEKTGRPGDYADMPIHGRQLPPPPQRLDAKYMVENFDVSIEDIRQLCIDYDPYSLVVSDTENRKVLRRSLQNELDMMKPYEQTKTAMALFTEDEMEWLEVGPGGHKRKRNERGTGDEHTRMPGIAEEAEESSDSDDDHNDWTEPQVEQRKRMIGPMLDELDKSIWFQ
jgi:hypothetical protein